MVYRMFLAGIPVRSELILELAHMVDDEELAQKLRSALANEITLLGLDVPERETILRALEDRPEELGELRATLLQEHVWRQREGLGQRAPARTTMKP